MSGSVNLTDYLTTTMTVRNCQAPLCLLIYLLFRLTGLLSDAVNLIDYLTSVSVRSYRFLSLGSIFLVNKPNRRSFQLLTKQKNRPCKDGLLNRSDAPLIDVLRWYSSSESDASQYMILQRFFASLFTGFKARCL